MSFDRDKPAKLLELKTEVQTDPATIPMGYDQNNVAVGVLGLINDPASNTGNENSTARDFTGDDLLHALTISPAAAAEYPVAVDTVLKQMAVESLVNYRSQVLPVKFKDLLIHDTAGIFNDTDGPIIKAAIIVEATGPKSRAEVLWGDDTVITKQDWFASKDS